METNGIAIAPTSQREALEAWKSGRMPGPHYVDRKGQTFDGVLVTIETVQGHQVRRDLVAPEPWQLGTVDIKTVPREIRAKVQKYWGQLLPKSYHYEVAVHYDIANLFVDYNLREDSWREIWDGVFSPELRTVSVPGKISEDMYEEDWEASYLNHMDELSSFCWTESGRPARWADTTRRDVHQHVTILIPPEAVRRFTSIVIPPRAVERLRGVLGASTGPKRGRGRPRNDAVRVAIETLMLWDVPVIEEVVQALCLHVGLGVPEHTTFWRAATQMSLTMETDGQQTDGHGRHRARQTLEGHSRTIYHLPPEARDAWRAFSAAYRRLGGQ